MKQPIADYSAKMVSCLHSYYQMNQDKKKKKYLKVYFSFVNKKLRFNIFLENNEKKKLCFRYWNKWHMNKDAQSITINRFHKLKKIKVILEYIKSSYICYCRFKKCFHKKMNNK